MDNTHETAAAVLIDQTRLPNVRDQAWWNRFCPPWMTAHVRDDGIVEIRAAKRYLMANGRPGPSDPAAVHRRHRNVQRWFERGPKLLRTARITSEQEAAK